VEASLTPVTNGNEGSTKSVETCPVKTSQIQLVRKGLSRTRRRRRLRMGKTKMSNVANKPEEEVRSRDSREQYTVMTELESVALREVLPDLC